MMCDFCDNEDACLEAGWLVPEGSLDPDEGKEFCFSCSGDGDSDLYDFWADHTGWEVYMP